MNNLLLGLLILGFVFSASAQKSDLPDILRPEEGVVTAADADGLNVAKLVRRGTFDFEKNELNLRGGGAFYSFSTKSHDYNKIPQLLYEQGNLGSGFYGSNFGLISDLGESELFEIPNEHPALVFLRAYRPRTLERDISAERDKWRRTIGGQVTRRRVPALKNHVYLLRSISFDEADVLVAFRVVDLSEQSITIVWKILENFSKPIYRHHTDAELKALMDPILSDSAFADIDYTIENGEVILSGSVGYLDHPRLGNAIRQARIRRVKWNLTPKR